AGALDTQAERRRGDLEPTATEEGGAWAVGGEERAGCEVERHVGWDGDCRAAQAAEAIERGVEQPAPKALMTPLGMDAEGRDPGFARLQPILEEGDLAGEREQEAASAALCFDDVAAVRDEIGVEKHLRPPGPD